MHENMVRRGSLLAGLICCFNYYSNTIMLVRTRTVMCFALCRKFNAQMVYILSTQGSHPCYFYREYRETSNIENVALNYHTYERKAFAGLFKRVEIYIYIFCSDAGVSPDCALIRRLDITECFATQCLVP